MNKIILVISMVVVCMPVFAKNMKKKQTTKGPTKQATKPVTNDIISVTMHRTLCFGYCPDYTIEMNKDGNTIYTAKRFNEDTGIFKKNIGSKKAAEIFSQFAAYRVDTCMEMYENRIPDLPGLNFTIKYKNKTQKIFNANFGPAFLAELAGSMDAVGKKTDKEDKTWKKTGMPKFE
jgi:Pyruvate/2-oxoacid:ferredoxin oxidoreductase delta subunit